MPRLKYVRCLIPGELVERYSEWTECVAFRFRRIDGGAVEIEVTNDLELLTRPDGEAGL